MRRVWSISFRMWSDKIGCRYCDDVSIRHSGINHCMPAYLTITVCKQEAVILSTSDKLTKVISDSKPWLEGFKNVSHRKLCDICKGQKITDRNALNSGLLVCRRYISVTKQCKGCIAAIPQSLRHWTESTISNSQENTYFLIHRLNYAWRPPLADLYN